MTRMTDGMSFSINYGMTNTVEWLFMGLGSSLTYKSKMATVCHFENV